MKLIRFGPPGREKPGVILPDGTWRDTSAFTPDYNEAFFGSDGPARLAVGEHIHHAAVGAARHPGAGYLLVGQYGNEWLARVALVQRCLEIGRLRAIGELHVFGGQDAAAHRREVGGEHDLRTDLGGFGGYQAIRWDARNRVYLGASESRKDGQAAGW